MACETLDVVANSLELTKLERDESNVYKYELEFGLSGEDELPLDATRIVFTYNGNVFTVKLNCSISENNSNSVLFLELPIGWQEDLLPCGVQIETEVSFLNCTTDACCIGGTPIEITLLEDPLDYGVNPEHDKYLTVDTFDYKESP